MQLTPQEMEKRAAPAEEFINEVNPNGARGNKDAFAKVHQPKGDRGERGFTINEIWRWFLLVIELASIRQSSTQRRGQSSDTRGICACRQEIGSSRVGD